MNGFRRWAATAIAASATALILTAPAAGLAGADPVPADPSAPSSSAPAAPGASGAPGTSAAPDPSGSPGAGDTSSDDPNGIKFGTPDMGKIHWEQFGGGDEGSAKTLDQFVTQIIGYALTGFGIAAVIGALCVCVLMIVGVKGRSSVAKTALESSIWIWVGCLIAGSFASIGGIILAAGMP